MPGRQKYNLAKAFILKCQDELRASESWITAVCMQLKIGRMDTYVKVCLILKNGFKKIIKIHLLTYRDNPIFRNQVKTKSGM